MPVHTLLRAPLSAPRSNKVRTTLWDPSRAAQCNGVFPSYTKKCSNTRERYIKQEKNEEWGKHVVKVYLVHNVDFGTRRHEHQHHFRVTTERSSMQRRPARLSDKKTSITDSCYVLDCQRFLLCLANSSSRQL